jgi:O-antigen ligase
MLIFYPRRLTHGLGLGLAALGGGALLLSSGLLPASLTARLAGITDFLKVVDVRGIHITDANFAIVERLAHWQAALEMMRAHPWLGVGLGNYSAAYADYALLNWPLSLGHAHNIYLQMWAETGLLGLMAYLSIWLTALALTVRVVRRASGWQRGLALGLLGVWAHLLTHQLVDNLHVNNTDLLLAVELGMLCALPVWRRGARLGDSAPLHYNAGVRP